MPTYSYSGPVKVFETYTTRKWTGETTAATERKARSNLAYQYKKQTGRNKTAKVTLTGKIFKIGGG